MQEIPHNTTIAAVHHLSGHDNWGAGAKFSSALSRKLVRDYVDLTSK